MAVSREDLQQAKQSGEQTAIAGIALALIDAGDTGEPAGIHRFEAGMALLSLGKHLESAQNFETAAEMLPGGSLIRARAWANGSIAHLRLGTLYSADVCARRVLDEYGHLTDGDYVRQIGAAYHVLGMSADRCRRYLEAADYFAEAAKIYTNPWQKVSAEIDQAAALACAAYQGDDREALRLAQELLAAVDTDALATYDRGRYGYMMTMSVTLHVAQDYAAALDFGNRALDVNLAANEAAECELLVWMTRSAQALGNVTHARALLARARRLERATHSFVWDDIRKLEGALSNA